MCRARLPRSCHQPLQVAATFIAEVSVGERVLSGVEFVVIENKGQALLGRETAIALGVLSLGTPVQVTADRLTQLVERRTTVREVEGSSPRPDQHSGS